MVYVICGIIGIFNAIVFCQLRDKYSKNNKEVIIWACVMLTSAGLLSAICVCIFKMIGIE
jgi:hypothetical protein